jgi:hypothetical protein
VDEEEVSDEEGIDDPLSELPGFGFSFSASPALPGPRRTPAAHLGRLTPPGTAGVEASSLELLAPALMAGHRLHKDWRGDLTASRLSMSRATRVQSGRVKGVHHRTAAAIALVKLRITCLANMVDGHFGTLW